MPSEPTVPRELTELRELLLVMTDTGMDTHTAAMLLIARRLDHIAKIVKVKQ